jgi:CcmD family protein
MGIKITTFLLSVILPTMLYAQDPEMAQLMRSNGKIYVVVAVVGIVFLGIIVYLVRIDRKISRMEKNQKQQS